MHLCVCSCVYMCVLFSQLQKTSSLSITFFNGIANTPPPALSSMPNAAPLGEPQSRTLSRGGHSLLCHTEALCLSMSLSPWALAPHRSGLLLFTAEQYSIVWLTLSVLLLTDIYAASPTSLFICPSSLLLGKYSTDSPGPGGQQECWLLGQKLLERVPRCLCHCHWIIRPLLFC